MLNIINFFSASKFLNDIKVLIGGTLVSQVIGILAIPLLTRLYSPEQFGEVGVFISYTSFAVLIVTLKLDIAIANEQRPNIRMVLFKSTLLISTILSLIITLLYWIFWGLDLLGFGELNSMAMFLIFPCILFGAFLSVSRFWFVGFGDFQKVSRALMSQSIFKNVIQIMVGYSKLLNKSGLYLGEILGRFFSLWSYIGQWPKINRSDLRLEKSKRVLKRFRSYPFLVLPSSLMDLSATLMLIPFIAFRYGIYEAGQVAMVIRILAIPVNLVIAGFSDIFHNKIVTIASDSKLAMTLFLRSSAVLTALGLLFFLIVLTFGRDLFTIVLGSDWDLAGSYAEIFIYWTVPQMIVSPLSRVVFIFNEQRKKLLYDALVLSNLLLAFGASSYLNWSVFVMLTYLAFTNVVLYVIYYYIIFKIIARNHVRDSGNY